MKKWNEKFWTYTLAWVLGGSVMLLLYMVVVFGKNGL